MPSLKISRSRCESRATFVHEPHRLPPSLVVTLAPYMISQVYLREREKREQERSQQDAAIKAERERETAILRAQQEKASTKSTMHISPSITNVDLQC